MKADQDYLAGLALFERYTHNTKIGRMLRIGGATVKNRLTLSYELSKIESINFGITFVSGIVQ